MKGGCVGQEKRKGIVFVISGPSGSGKTTLIKRLLRRKKSPSFAQNGKQESKKLRDKFRDNLFRVVSYTSRSPRGREKHGQDYVFVKKEQFRQKIRNRGFLEWQKILGEYYGTPRAAVEENVLAGRDVLLCIDVKGAELLRRKKGFYVVSIFILPSEQDWRRTLKLRLKARSSDSEKQIQKRLMLAEKEIVSARYYDYVIVNKNIDQSVKELMDTVILERRRYK